MLVASKDRDVRMQLVCLAEGRGQVESDVPSLGGGASELLLI